MRKFLFVMFILTIFVSVFAAPTTKIGAIETEYRMGKITLDEAMTYKVYVVVNQKLLPGRFKNLASPRSGTPILVEIYQHFDELSPQTQAYLRALLTRPTGLPNTYDTAHFRMHYALTGGDAVANETYVHNMADRFEIAYNFLITTRGYLSPPTDGSAGGNSKYDVYIKTLTGGVLGYTQPEVAGSYPWDDATSFIVMRKNYTVYPPEIGTIEVTSVHEFFHACQMAYSYNQPGWFMEVSSVWIEDEKYPDNDDEHYYLPDFFNYPYVSITREPSDPTYGMHCYASYIFGQYISEEYGDSAMRKIWEDNKYSTTLTSIQNIMSGFGTSRTNAFAEFWVWNYFTGSRNLAGLYPEGATYPTISIERTHSTYPANGSSSHAPEALASNYIVFNIPTGASGPFSITFDGADGANWVVQLVIPGSGTYDARRISLNGYGYGYLTLEESEYTGHSSLILIIGNVSTSGTGSNYSYHADFEEVGPSYDPPRNLVAESGHSGQVPLNWDEPIGGGVGGTIEISNDDGTAAGYVPWDLTGYGYGHTDWEAAKFNAASDCTLQQVKGYFIGSGTVTIHIAQDNGGVPGDDYTGSPITTSVTSYDWTTVDVPGSGIPLPAGDFWITYERYADTPACAIDADTLVGNPNCFHDDLDNLFMGMGDYLLRAVVTSPSTGISVTGYTIHRANITGGPYSFIGTSPTESYTDMSVVDGTSYYYVVTANYSDAGESGYSNEDMAVPGAGTGGEYDTLLYDDGLVDYVTAGIEWGWQCAVVFEPTAPCQLIALRYLTIPDSISTGVFGIGMYRWTGSRIAEPIFDPFPTIFNPGVDGWTEVDMTAFDLFFSSGFAASYVFYDTTARLGMDNVDDDYSYFYSPDDETWFGASYRFYIQAVVRYIDTSETYTISGQVLLSGGSGGSPPPTDLSGSIVRIIETSDADTTDVDGNYSIELPSGVYTVEAWHPGYVPQDISVGLTENVTQNFSLIPINTPLNSPRNLMAYSYMDSSVLLTWDSPIGSPGTYEKIYYFDPTTDTIRYMDSLSTGDIFDTRFDVWFPCTLTTAGIMFYSTGSYPDVSLHIWADDGTGYPDIGTDLIDSMVISPTPDSAGYVQWTTIDFSTEPLVIWPGQSIHLGIRNLSANHPSVTASSSEATYDPAVSRYYSNSASAWFDWGEAFEYIEVSYFESTMRLAPTTIANREYIPVSKLRTETFSPYSIFVSPSFAPESQALALESSGDLLAPFESEGLTEYWIYHSTSASGPFGYIGTCADLDSLYYLDEYVENGVLNYYYVIASYDHGNSDPSDTVSALPLAWNDTAWVLLIDDDGSNYMILSDGTYPDDEGIPLAQILLDLDVPFNVLELPPGYFVGSAGLADYQAVIWNCGIGYTGGWTLSDSEQANIETYLDGGGQFALFSQDFIYDIYGGAATTFSTGEFIYDYLGISHVTQDAWTIHGDTSGTFTGYDFADGQTFGVTNLYTNWQVFPDYLMSFLGDTMMSLYVSGVGGPVGAVYEDAGFKTAFLACTPFAMVDGTGSNTVQEFIRRLLFGYFGVHNPYVTMHYDLCAGWNLLSIPVQPADSSTDVVFPGNSAVYGFDAVGDTFFTPTIIEPGKGYFVLFDSPTSFDVSGVELDTVILNLNGIWNLVGVPWEISGSISFDEASFTPNNFYANSYFGFSNEEQTYILPTTAIVGQGYWVAVSGNCIFDFPCASGMMALYGKSGAYGMPPAPPYVDVPKEASIGNIYPNPFNSACALNITIPEDEMVKISVRDISGKLLFVRDRMLKSGNHTLRWNGTNLDGSTCPSGVYMVTVRIGNREVQRRALLVK